MLAEHPDTADVLLRANHLRRKLHRAITNQTGCRLTADDVALLALGPVAEWAAGVDLIPMQTN